MQEKNTIFSVFWYTTFLFWGAGVLMGLVYENYCTGLAAVFAGPLVSFVLAWSISQFKERKKRRNDVGEERPV